MSGPLAIPTFVTGARDQVAATDVYTQTSAAPINNVQAVDAGPKLTLAGALRGGKLALKDLQTIMSLSKAAQSLLKGGSGNLLGRVGNFSSLLSGGLKSLIPGISPDILNGISSAQSLLRNGSGIYATINNVTRQIKTGNFTSVAAVSGLINQVTGATTSVLRDTNAGIGSIAGLIGVAQTFKVPNSFDALCKTFDQPSINKIATLTLPSCIGHSDLGSLTSMANLCSPGTLKMANDNAVSDFMQNYTGETGQSFTQVTANYSEMKDTFGKIDPPWNTVVRSTAGSFENIPNITCVQTASPDFVDTMKTSIKSNVNSPDTPMLLGTVFPKTDVASEVKSQFPGIVLVSSTSQKIADDPRLNGPVLTNIVLPNNSPGYGNTAGVATTGGQVDFSSLSPSMQLIQSNNTQLRIKTTTLHDLEGLRGLNNNYQSGAYLKADAFKRQALAAVAAGQDTSVSEPLFAQAAKWQATGDGYTAMLDQMSTRINELNSEIATLSASNAAAQQ